MCFLQSWPISVDVSLFVDPLCYVPSLSKLFDTVADLDAGLDGGVRACTGSLLLSIFARRGFAWFSASTQVFAVLWLGPSPKLLKCTHKCFNGSRMMSQISAHAITGDILWKLGCPIPVDSDCNSWWPSILSRISICTIHYFLSFSHMPPLKRRYVRADEIVI